MVNRILGGLCVMLAMAGCGSDGSTGSTSSASSCTKVCACVADHGGDNASCMNDCSGVVSQGGNVKGECEAKLEDSDLSACTSACAGFSTGETPGSGGASGSGGSSNGSGGGSSSANADCQSAKTKLSAMRAALHCPKVSGIETDCEPALAAKPQCADEFHGVVTCALAMPDSVYECTGDGKADLKDGICQSESDAFDACMGS
jgi:hypothetical protein